MRIHFIAIGGAAMHNLAIALAKNGHEVSGSDDEIFEPSKSRLKEHNLLPNQMGWDANRITADLDLIILGMHAKKDNPELLKAQEMNIRINSYPEFIFEQSKNKKRVVIAGSHGKTTTTSMILHVLKKLNRSFDFMVGAQIKGFDTMVQLSDSKVIIIEGDEYFSSPIDMKAKFLWYKPDVAVITGIAWDHINVYPSKELYNEAFSNFIESIDEDGYLFYFRDDVELKKILKSTHKDIHIESYKSFDYKLENNETLAVINKSSYPLSVFGEHNIQNMQAARLVCHTLGISDDEFFKSITSFEGASNRLELIAESDSKKVFKDFAHSPSKLMATVKACKNQFPENKLLAVMELHTFSSLNKDFLEEYCNTLNDADVAIVYFDPAVIKHKNLENFDANDIIKAFNRQDLIVVNSGDDLRSEVLNHSKTCQTILLMSSGNFGGIDRNEMAIAIV